VKALAQTVRALTSSLQCRAYLITDEKSRTAAVVDARFDWAPRILDELRKEGLDLKYAIDTHTHADHLSGSERLRNLTGCKVVMSGATRSKVPDVLARDDDEFSLGELSLHFLHTPGHTPDSMCVRIGNALITGDTLFIGGSARTDFMGGSAAALFDSFRRIEALGEDTEVHPGHDYNRKLVSTIGEELRTNSAFRERDKRALIARLDVPGPLPNNMAEMLSFNMRAGLAESSIVRAREMNALGVPGRDYTLVDVRNPDEFAAGRIEGAYALPLPEVNFRLHELDQSKRPLLFVCKAGIRATLAMMAARKAGLSECLLLEGGMEAYAVAKLPMIADQGTPKVIATASTGPAAACAAGGCAAPSDAHTWTDWVI
jgi:glyoxylase-like metal-dependent hydrolase (beta-lactamase superfamily II)